MLSTESLPYPLPVSPGSGGCREIKLMQASKFGFMIESCILASRRCEPLICPAHKEHPLPVRDVAPDLVSLSILPHPHLEMVCLHSPLMGLFNS